MLKKIEDLTYLEFDYALCAKKTIGDMEVFLKKNSDHIKKVFNGFKDLKTGSEDYDFYINFLKKEYPEGFVVIPEFVTQKNEELKKKYGLQ